MEVTAGIFPKSRIFLTGGASGLGKALVSDLSKKHDVFSIDTKHHKDGNICDVRDLCKLKELAEYLGSIDIVINCAGINFIDWIENTSGEMWDRIMDVNAKGILNTTQAFLPMLLESGGTILNIVSNASHMPMTNSIAYNASKGAAHIMTLQMARELGPKGITVFGISPNRLANTEMSDYIDKKVCELRGWTPEFAREYQLKALPAGEETDVAALSEFITFLLSNKRRHKYLTGTILPYGK